MRSSAFFVYLLTIWISSFVNMEEDESPILPSKSLIVFSFTFTPTVYLNLSFVHGVEITFLFFSSI